MSSLELLDDGGSDVVPGALVARSWISEPQDDLGQRVRLPIGPGLPVDQPYSPSIQPTGLKPKPSLRREEGSAPGACFETLYMKRVTGPASRSTLSKLSAAES